MGEKRTRPQEAQPKRSPSFRTTPLKDNARIRVSPPPDLTLTGLFNHAFDRGAGQMARAGVAEPWTVHALEAAFDALSRSVSTRSIENWRSGSALPSARNIHVLARIFSGGDAQLQGVWLDALIAARERTPKTETAAQAGDDTPAPEPPTRSRLPRAAAALLGLVGLAVAGLALWPAPAPPRVSDIRFCTDAGFDAQAKRCSRARERFPAGTTLIHVSFESEGVADGQPFERRWYRDGEMFLSRDGFFDDAWEDWTWLRNPNGHDPGRYHLRIIIDGRVATAGFTVEGAE